MKTYITQIIQTTCLVIISVVLVSAKPKNKLEQHLVAKWKYCSGSGGFTGKGPGWDASKGIYFEFKKNGSFKKTENKKVVETDTYKVETIKRVEEADEILKLIFKKQMSMLASFNGDTLMLREEVADGFNYKFVRSK